MKKKRREQGKQKYSEIGISERTRLTETKDRQGGGGEASEGGIGLGAIYERVGTTHRTVKDSMKKCRL